MTSIVIGLFLVAAGCVGTGTYLLYVARNDDLNSSDGGW